MTTGRINQVTAEEAAVGNTACAEPSVAVAVRCVGSLLPIKFYMEQNASSHGFRTCPYHAPRRRQYPIAANRARLEGVPPIVGYAAPAQN